MSEAMVDILKEMKRLLPNCLGVAIYSLKDGLIISEDINFPDYDPDYTSAIHVSIWDTIINLIKMLPNDLTGKIHNILLELKSAYFQIQIVENEEFLILAAMENKGNLGMLRVIIKKFLPRLNKSFEE